MNQFSIEIPNEKVKAYKLITAIMLLINLLVFAVVLFKTADGFDRKISWIGFILNAISLSIYFLFVNKKTKRLSFYKVEIGFIISALLWLLIGQYLFAALLFLFAFLGFYVNKKFIIRFSEDGIEYPGFPVKKFLWEEVDQLILKDNILTIDLKDNRLLQFSLNEKNGALPVEKDFNEFCNRMIKGSA